MRKCFVMPLLLLVFPTILAQESIKGMVMQVDGEERHVGLSGASVYWKDSQTGTITDDKGWFTLPYSTQYSQLIISHVGFRSDTLNITESGEVHHFLKPNNSLDEVVVTKKKDPLKKSFFSAQNIITVNSEELLKAACCNLSESFETNPSIDVNYSDALTGTKQIRMLGLTSPYLLITEENIPMIRGASQAYGLTFTPGTWVESIQITKGAGSVVNGYESISGQINTELVKPFTDVPFFLNIYGNRNGRLELNLHGNQKLNETLSLGTYVHHNRRDVKVDNNKDGFLDAPLANQLNVLARLQYQDPKKGWVSFLNLRFLSDNKQAGQVNFDPSAFIPNGLIPETMGVTSWGSEIRTGRFDSSLKIGYVFPDLPFQSVGFQVAYGNHAQEAYYGFRRYDIDHQSVYSNLIFNSIIGNTKNKFKVGLTLAHDAYDEQVDLQTLGRSDNSGGLFFEYLYENLERLSINIGARVDSHNRLGTFVTPRLHVRYTPWEHASLRGSAGRGRRVANIFAENQQLFASSRTIQLLGNGGPIYGLEPEDAWNFGASFLQGFTLFDGHGSIAADFYRTDFKNQVVVDWENPRAIFFYNLEGRSYANSFQLELSYAPVERLEVRTAFKYYDVRTDYRSGRLQKPLLAPNRYFLNMAYATKAGEKGQQWRFDYTLQSLGKQRLPSTEVNPPEFRLDDFVDGYSLMNVQMTKVFSEKFEVYVGGENISNIRQSMPVLGANDPFGANFDTSIVYAPIMGRMIYAGLRYRLE